MYKKQQQYYPFAITHLLYRYHRSRQHLLPRLHWQGPCRAVLLPSQCHHLGILLNVVRLPGGGRVLLAVRSHRAQAHTRTREEEQEEEEKITGSKRLIKCTDSTRTCGAVRSLNLYRNDEHIVHTIHDLICIPNTFYYSAFNNGNVPAYVRSSVAGLMFTRHCTVRVVQQALKQA